MTRCLKIRIFLILSVLILALCLTSCDGLNKSQAEITDSELKLSDETQNRIKEAETDGSPTLVMSNVEAKPGDDTVITINLVNNPGIIGMSMTLSYDESVLSLEKVQNGDAFGSGITLDSSDDLSSGCNFLWSGDDISEEDIKDGMILALRFRIKKDSVGKTPIIMVCDQDGTLDRNLSVVNLTVSNGYITIAQ